MFSIVNIIKYLTFISYLGFFISSISGFNELSNNFELCKLLVSVLIFLNIPIIGFIEYTNREEDTLITSHYSRSYALFIMSLMVIGISPIGIGFGIYGIVISISNLLLGVFNCSDTITHPEMPNINNQQN